jgi:acyl-CoA synthetase (AMP-forming)/AMP-acid ligase II
MLKVGGENVSIAEVESVVLEHADVIVACVVSVPDGHLHEVPVVAVVTRNEAADREGSILDYCRSRLADFKVPRSVIEMKLDEMPLTGSGKVSRMEVRALVLARLEKARN